MVNRRHVFPIDYKLHTPWIIGVLVLCIVGILAIVYTKNKERTNWENTKSYVFDIQINMNSAGNEIEVKRLEGITRLDKHSLKRELDAMYTNAVENDADLDSNGMVTMKIRHTSKERPNGQLRILLTSDSLEDLYTVPVKYSSYSTFKYKSMFSVSEFVVV